MSFRIMACVKGTNDKGEPQMRVYDGPDPFDSSLVDCEKFYDLCQEFGEAHHEDDYSSPSFYCRPKDYAAIETRLRDFETNAEPFLGWLAWLQQHPDVWMEGYC